MKTATLDHPLTITEARKILGIMFDAAFEQAVPVRIMRGNRMIRFVPEMLPEPIEVYPEGSIGISDERVAWLNGIPHETFRPNE